MATVISKATGNLTSGTNFATTDTATGALNLIRFAQNTSIAAAATVTSASFTVTNGVTVDGVLLYLKLFDNTTPTGTFKVDLQRGGVSQASVTVNKTDLPANPSASSTSPLQPVFLKFTSTHTGNGAATYTLVLTTTGTLAVYYGITASGSTNVTHALRTTTAADPAAGDDIYVTGELTGAGTHNSFTITMNSTAATAYGNGTVNSTTAAGGNLSIGPYGTLSYGTSASTNYILRLAGDLVVSAFGTLNIGSSGAEIPRNSTAVLEFAQASASGDFGLIARDGATVNIYGLSRTSGKNVVKCKLTSTLSGTSVGTSTTSTGLATTSNTRDSEATGTSLLGLSIQENTSNTAHSWALATASTAGNTTQTISFWVAPGTGASNNRYVRAIYGNNTAPASVTNGFFVDIDMQAGTIGTITAIGNGTATSASITAQGSGFVVKMTGRCSSATATPTLNICACAVSGTIAYLGASNWPLVIDHVGIVTASSISDTTVNVDADTGWLSGDVVAVASTTRTQTNCELFALNANAGASSFTTALFPAGVLAFVNGGVSHSGSAPAVAEVILLTRNVKIRSTSTTLYTFAFFAQTCTVNVSWAEFYRLGLVTVGKRGIEVDSSTAGVSASAKSFTYCSIHDTTTDTFVISSQGTNNANVTFSNNTLWFSAQIAIAAALTTSDWTMDSNCTIYAQAFGYSLSDIGGIFTNNTVVGNTSSISFRLAETNGVIGTFSGNTAHSGNSGLDIAAICSGTIDDLTLWRCASGLSLSAFCADLLFTDLTLFGHTTNLMSITADTPFNLSGATFGSDGAFPSTNGININANMVELKFSNVDFSGGSLSGVGSPSVDFLFTANPCYIKGICQDCNFLTAVTTTNWTSESYISHQNYTQQSTDHRTYLKYGTLSTDTSISHTASPSLRAQPNSASFKLESAPDNRGVLAVVASGASTPIGVWVRKSNTSVYNGNQPRLIQRANPSLGQDTDVVLATAAAANGTWEQLTATVGAAPADGVWEFVVDCDGTVGWVNIDDWTVG